MQITVVNYNHFVTLILALESFHIMAILLHLVYAKDFHKMASLPFTRNVSTSFPFNNFSVILEYGGPYASSRLSSLHPKSDALPQVHFIHVKIENHLTPIVLCEGFHACSHPGSTRVI